MLETKFGYEDKDYGDGDSDGKIERSELRVMYGSSWEGYSVREVYYDKQDNIIGWTKVPLFSLEASVEDVRKEILDKVKMLDEALDATDKPVIQEIELEK